MNEIALKWQTVPMRWVDMTPYEHNARKMKVSMDKNLDDSLSEFDVVEIPVIDADNVIIGGHQRQRRMLALGRGDEMVDVRKPNRKLTEEEFKKLNFMLNGIKGDFVDEILREHFTGIIEFEDYGMQLAELEDLHQQTMESVETPEPEYAIVAKMSEEYQSIVVVVKNAIDWNFLKEKLGLDQRKCYKSSRIEGTHVMQAQELIERLA
jgi:hypothetical protein